MYIYTCESVHIVCLHAVCVHVCVRVCVCVRARACVCMCVYVCARQSVNTRQRASVHACAYVYITHACANVGETSRDSTHPTQAIRSGAPGTYMHAAQCERPDM